MAVSLVKDINVDGEGGTPQGTIEAAGRLFFSAWDRPHGNELWVSDGTQVGTRLLADLVPGPASSAPSRLTPVGGKVYFTTNPDTPNVSGLWVSDGTADGTRRLTDLQPINAMFEAGGLLFFQANAPSIPGSSSVGVELYVSDGTEAGTRLVKDLNPGPDSTYPLNTAFKLGERLLFGVGSGPEPGLWVTNGNAAGTERLQSALPGRYSGESSPSWAVGPGGFAYFAASTPQSGVELWKTDGTPAGTSLVTDLEPGPVSSTPVALSNLNGRLYFHTVAPDQSSNKLWSTDGTAAGTRLVRTIDGPGGIPSAIVQPRAGGPGLFVAGTKLWRTDGTDAGTAVVHEHSDWGFSHNAVASGGWFYYTISTSRITGFPQQELWRSDGTATNTQRVDAMLPSPPPFPQGPAPVVDFRGDVFFTGSATSNTDYELLRLAPDRLTPEVIQTNPARPYSSSPQKFFTAGDRVYFLTRPYDYGTYKLWSTDGTEAGTVQVFDTGYDPYMGGIQNWGAAAYGNSIVFTIGPKVWLAGPTPGSQRLISELEVETNGMAMPAVAGDKIFFSSYDPAEFSQGVYKMRLWVSDGGGPARSIRTDAAGNDFSVGFGSRPVAVGDVLYFPGQDSEGNVELWRSDGTPQGTRLVRDLLPAGVNPTAGSWPEALTNVNGTVYFTALDGPFDPQGGGVRRLYKTDGTVAGTVRVSDTLRVYGEYANGLRSIGNTVYLNATDEADPKGGELYRTDGTRQGTRLVADVVPGAGGISPSQMTVVGSRLFFVGWDAGYELYVSDGTAAGTRLLSDSLGYAVTDHTYPLSGPYGLTAAGNMLYFVASDGSRGAEVWRSDGTPAGTAIVEDLNPGGPWAHGAFWQVTFNSMHLTTLAPLGDAVIFSGSDGRRGAEVWKARYAGEPTADAGGGPGAGYRAAEGQVITVSAAGSRPGTGGAIVSYEWDLDFDGTFEPTATGQTVPYTGGDGPRTAFVAVRVTDASGNTHIDTAPVVLSDRAPTLSVTGAATTTEGAPYELRLAVADNPGDDRVSTWWVDWGDGSDTQQVTGSPNGSPLTVTHVYGNGPASFDVTVTATDEDGTYTPAGKRVGLLDESFGGDGRVDNPFRSERALAVLPDGRIVTAGNAPFGNGGDFLLSRYRPDGTLDPTFGDEGNVTAQVAPEGSTLFVSAVAVQGDGKVLVAGTSIHEVVAEWVVARFSSDGTIDPSFGVDGIFYGDALEGSAADLALYPDGRIIVAGSSGRAGTGLDFAAVRLTPAGVRDGSFGAAGVVTTSLGAADSARAVVVQTDGKVVLAGVANDGPSSTLALIRYNTDGTLDATFAGDGTVNGSEYDRDAQDLALMPDGKLVVAGAMRYGTTVEPIALRYLPNGTLDTTFSQGGRFRGGSHNIYGEILQIAPAPGGNLALVTSAGLTVGRLSRAGWPDNRFGRGWPYDNGVNRYDPASPADVHHMTDVAVAPDGSIVALGHTADGSFLVRVNSEPPALSVNVANVPPTGASAGPDRTVREGERVYLTGTFTDPGVNEPRTYRWRVTASNGQVVPDGNATAFNFVPADEGTYTVEFTVTDDSGQSSSDTAVISVYNAPPVFQRPVPDPIPSPAGTEGREVVINLWAAGDPGPADTVTHRWSVALAGAGNPPLAEGDGYVARFTPADDGVYYLTLTATDNDGASARDLIFLNIANAPPQITLGNNSGAFVGDEYVLSLTANDPSPADDIRSWRVAWGDGQSATYGPGDTATARHTYAAAGQYIVQVTATDDDNTYAAPSKTVTVVAVPTLADGTLTVTGTAGNDIVELRGGSDGRLTVLVNGASRTYAAGSVSRVVVNVLGGNDELDTLGAVPETSADLGDGADKVVHGGTAAGSGLTVAGGAGNDIFQVDGAAGGSAVFDGGASTTVAPREVLVFNGTAGNDTIRVNPTTAGSPATVTVTRDGGASVRAVSVDGVSALGGDGNDTLTLADTSAAVEVLLGGGRGDDTFVVGDPSTPNAWPAFARTTIDGGGPGVAFGTAGIDSVTYNDQAFNGPGTGPGGAVAYALSPTAMSRGPATISHPNMDAVTLNTGSLADTISVTQSTFGGVSPALTVNAGLPDGATASDSLTLNPLQGAMGGQFTSTGPGAGRYTFSNYGPVAFTGVERLTGPDYTGPTVASASFVPAPRAEIELLFSEDVRSSLMPQDLVLTHLPTGATSHAGLLMNLSFRSASGSGVPTRAVWVQRIAGNLNPGRYRATLPAGSVQDTAGNRLAQDFVFEFDVPAWVTARRLFYNNSSFDGANPAATGADDNAVAPLLTPLLPGQSPTLLNVSNYARGINGIMIDMLGVPGAPVPRWTADDFEFHAGNGGDPSAWAAAPRPASVSTRAISGPPGSYRVTVTWADGAIKNTWLRATVKPTANTGLSAPDVFYWGSLVGETGDPATPRRVSAADVSMLRRAVAAASAAGTTVPVGSPYDVNRDGRINALDVAAARMNLFNTLRTIEWPVQPNTILAASKPATIGVADDPSMPATSILTS